MVGDDAMNDLYCMSGENLKLLVFIILCMVGSYAIGVWNGRITKK
jgi:hypothetical protein